MIDLRKSLIEQRVAQNAEGCVKTANDLARYRHLLDAYRPTLIIETGTFSGKSARWFSQWAPVITIDVDMRNLDLLVRDAGRCPHPPFHPIEFVQGSSILPAVVAHCYEQIGDPDMQRVFVVLDSDHSAVHVLHEISLYSPMVSRGSHLVVEDTIVRWCPWELYPEGPYEGSPLDAVEYFLRLQLRDVHEVAVDAAPFFEMDLEIEDMFPTTQHPCGWLKRTA